MELTEQLPFSRVCYLMKDPLHEFARFGVVKAHLQVILINSHVELLVLKLCLTLNADQKGEFEHCLMVGLRYL